MALQLAVAAVAACAAFVAPVAAFGTRCPTSEKIVRRQFPPTNEMPSNLKVALFGDAGAGNGQRYVLEMVKNWGAEFVIHLGDFEYQDDAALFENNINAVLGPDYPYFGAIGNHDVDAWRGSGGHEARLLARLERSNASQACSGEYGVDMACYYKGLYFVLSGVGTRGGVGHDDYIAEAFSAHPSAIWRLCAWHKNQRLFQIGGKSSETGYAVYDRCREYGAIVATGHEHSYARTYTMASYVDQVVANFNSTINMREGENFAFVSGLGGNSVRSWNEELIRNPWWAAYGASNNGASDGPLLCTFKVNGDPRKAECFMTDRLGQTYDRFDVYSWVGTGSPATSEAAKSTCSRPFVEFAVASPADDAVEDLATGVINTDGVAIPIQASKQLLLRFADVALKQGAQIGEAHLQLFGVRGRAESDPMPKLEVRVELSGNAEPFTKAPMAQRTFSAPLVWDVDSEDFESSTIWNSVDLAPLLQQVLNRPDWQAGNAIVVSVTGAADLAVAASERSLCQAPTLTFELARQC